MKISILHRVVLNVTFTLIAFWVISFAYKNVHSYHWMYNSLLKGNYQTIKKYHATTIDQRYQLKMEFDAVYMQFVRDNTPLNAVILMPGREVFFPENNETPFKSGKNAIGNHIWKLRFLHPRKIVHETDTNNKYANSITHVAIVNGWGYDKLNYQVPDEERQPFAILPIN